MSGVKTTNATSNNISTAPDNTTMILISRLYNPTSVRGYNTWTDYDTIYWSKYQIKETDMRVKTATFTSDTYLDLTTGVYNVMITSPFHEDFAGVILSVEKDNRTGLYNYQCQDYTRNFQDKWEINVTTASLHRLLKHIITKGELPLKGDISKKQKDYDLILSGLKPAYQYDQEYWNPSIKNFNPMSTTYQSIIKGKSSIEIIRDYVFGTGAYIDVYTNKNGILQIEPYHKTDWLTSNVEIPFEAIQDMRVNFNTTNIITGVQVQSQDQLGLGTGYDSIQLMDLDLNAFFGDVGASISNPNEKTTTASASSNVSKKSTSTKTTKKISNNPYKTKKKNIYINTDKIGSPSNDNKFMKDFAKLLKKQGWNPVIIGRGPNTHTEKYMKNHKNGVWFCIYGGADGAVFKETVSKNSYTNKLKKNNLRTVIGMRSGCSILKGGKCYKYLVRAWDDNYSPSSYKGISYPLNMLTKGKVPIMYASTAEKMVAKFLKGGDNPSAC